MNYLYNYGLVDIELLSTEDICTVSIAKALARINRFCGNFNSMSVGQHAVLVAELVHGLGGTTEEQLAALHHDDSEVFIGDVPHMVKAACIDLQAIEATIMDVIDEKYGIDVRCDLVKEADEIVGAAEMHHHMDMAPLMARFHFHLPKRFDQVRLGQTALDPWPETKVLSRYMEMHDDLCLELVREEEEPKEEEDKGCLN